MRHRTDCLCPRPDVVSGAPAIRAGLSQGEGADGFSLPNPGGKGRKGAGPQARAAAEGRWGGGRTTSVNRGVAFQHVLLILLPRHRGDVAGCVQLTDPRTKALRIVRTEVTASTISTRTCRCQSLRSRAQATRCRTVAAPSRPEDHRPDEPAREARECSGEVGCSSCTMPVRKPSKPTPPNASSPIASVAAQIQAELHMCPKCWAPVVRLVDTRAPEASVNCHCRHFHAFVASDLTLAPSAKAAAHGGVPRDHEESETPQRPRARPRRVA
jgi:hypothetical protein